jgi:flagellar protein FliJ
MTKSKRFEPIRDMADNFATNLRRGVAEAQRKVDEAERQLTQLQTYRDDYVKKSGHGAASVDAVRLQNYRSFLDRLSQAIRSQGEVVANARHEHEKRRIEWSQKRVEAKALGKAVERFKSEERRLTDRREQLETDDGATRRHLEDSNRR